MGEQLEERITVGELIECLQSYDPALPVMVWTGHEEAMYSYLSDCNRRTLQNLEGEYEDEYAGDAGFPYWVNGETPEFEAVLLA